MQTHSKIPEQSMFQQVLVNFYYIPAAFAKASQCPVESQVLGSV